MSNPCFIINTKFAHTFVNNLKQINMTSDTYIHNKLPQIDKDIQAFSILPIPIFELSTDRVHQKFLSEIHPKGFNAYDIKRNRLHIKKIMYKEFLCIGHPRCGTGSVAYYLTEMGHKVGHEKMRLNGVSSWMLAVEDVKYPWGDDINKNRFYFKNIIHIVRNPINAIPSIILENKYSIILHYLKPY